MVLAGQRKVHELFDATTHAFHYPELQTCDFSDQRADCNLYVNAVCAASLRPLPRVSMIYVHSVMYVDTAQV